jgi:hypothetical protein
LFGLLFFATVAFAAVNLLLPMLLPVDPLMATRVAAVVALTSALPIAIRGSTRRRADWIWLGVATVLFLGLAIGLPRLVPPVPLRVQSTTFSSEFVREKIEPADIVGSGVESAELRGTLYGLARVFAPSVLPTTVNLEWRHDGETIRTTRDIEITAHDLGFRVWDGYRAESGTIDSGNYEIIFRTKGDRIFGRAEIEVTP